MNEQDIEQNLQALGDELEAMHIQEPVELLMIGGGFMLTQLRNRASTTDVDALVLHPDFYSENYRLFKAAVSFVAQDKGLSAAWLSTNIGDFLRLVGPPPPMTRWRQFGPLVISIPPMYVFHLSTQAGRRTSEGQRRYSESLPGTWRHDPHAGTRDTGYVYQCRYPGAAWGEYHTSYCLWSHVKIWYNRGKQE